MKNPEDAAARPAKKTETVEVRIPFEAKQAFLAACREDGRTASDVIRGAIDAYVTRRNRPAVQGLEAVARPIVKMFPQHLRKRRYLFAGATGALSLAAIVALPSAASPTKQADRLAAFVKLDRNGDGSISYDEFLSQPR